MTKKMLGNAYGLDGAAATQAFYDEWADSYDAEVAENGYVTPARCAAALAEHWDDKTTPVLDIGCGTGVSGAALVDAGFKTLDGSDFSAEMLDKARAKSIYRNLYNTDLTTPFPFAPGTYQVISAMGVLNPGHAPASTLDEVLNLLEPSGLFVFSLNDHALADNSYEVRVGEHVDSGNARLLFKEYGDHLPAIDLKSNVYILEKA